MRIGRPTVRKLAWAAIAGQVAFVAAWIVAGALEPGYSHLDQAVSELGARGAAHPLIVNAGLVAMGLAVAALGFALPAALPPRRAARVATWLFVAAGLAIVVAGVIPLDCGLSRHSCMQQFRAGDLSWHEYVHLWASILSQVLLALTPFAVARALWPGPVAPLAVGAGAFGIVLGIVAFVLEGVDGVPDGLVQRIGLAVVHVWVVIVAIGVLHATRSPWPPGRLIGLRPRDFFAREWTGDGELVVRPFFLWRRLAPRFAARRECTWVSDSVWRIDDEATFGDSQVRQRRMFCEFVADDRVLITGSDMPDGAEAVIEEDGYRMVPFRMAFPIGPVALPVRCHDVSHVEPDGTLVNSFEARSIVLGVLLARISFRVRPEPHLLD
jgi:hypothetical membrane protein